MKATIDVPDDLYRRVKAKSALQGRAIRDVTAELFESYVRGGSSAASSGATSAWSEESEVRERHVPTWFGIARRLGARSADPSMEAIRESIARGWAAETAASEKRLSSRAKK